MAKALAFAACIPVPGVAFLVALFGRHDRLAKYYGLQAGWWSLLWFLVLAAVSPALDAGRGVAMFAALLWLVWMLGLAWCAIGIVRGNYVRLRPVWDILVQAATWRTTAR